jgi:hypothetical protein
MFLVINKGVSMTELKTSNFPALTTLQVGNCGDLKKIVISGCPLLKLTIEGECWGLELIDVQIISLKKCVLTKLKLNKDIIFLTKRKIPLMVVDATRKVLFAEPDQN